MHFPVASSRKTRAPVRHHCVDLYDSHRRLVRGVRYLSRPAALTSPHTTTRTPSDLARATMAERSRKSLAQLLSAPTQFLEKFSSRRGLYRRPPSRKVSMYRPHARRLRRASFAVANVVVASALGYTVASALSTSRSPLSAAPTPTTPVAPAKAPVTTPSRPVPSTTATSPSTPTRAAVPRTEPPTTTSTAAPTAPPSTSTTIYQDDHGGDGTSSFGDN